MLTISWTDACDSAGSELGYSHVMRVEILEIVNGNVTKIKKLEDRRILVDGTYSDRTKKHHIGNWRIAEQSDVDTMQQLGL